MKASTWERLFAAERFAFLAVGLLCGLALSGLYLYASGRYTPCYPRCLWETTGSVLDASCFMDCGGCP